MDTPVVVVDKAKLLTNIRDMASFAKERGLDLRPHVKAHKSTDIAGLQAREGVVGFTVAKLSEAEVLFQAGFADITVAFPLIGIGKLARVAKLLQAGCRLTLVVDSPQGLQGISALDYPGGIDVLVKVDSGLARCGFVPGPALFSFAEQVFRSQAVNFKGLLTHAGHAYGCANVSEVKKIGHQEGKQLIEAAQELERRGVPVPVVSVGSTPTAKFAGEIPGVTEIRPGNYVFYDATQVALGVATREQCSLKVYSTVVSCPAPDRAVIDAGAKVLALDRGAHGSSNINGHGLLPREEWCLSRLSEEHGVIIGEKLPSVGEIIEIIPNHACPVINLSDYFEMDGEKLPVSMRGCSY